MNAMDAAFQPLPVPDTGHVQTDLAQLLTAFVATAPGPVTSDTLLPTEHGAG